MNEILGSDTEALVAMYAQWPKTGARPFVCAAANPIVCYRRQNATNNRVIDHWFLRYHNGYFNFHFESHLHFPWDLCKPSAHWQPPFWPLLPSANLRTRAHGV